MTDGKGSIGFHDPPSTPIQVTQEDGGRLNAFAREPRMVVMEQGEANGPSRMLIAGVALVVLLVAVAAGIS